MTSIFIALGIYIVLLPILFRLIGVAQKKLVVDRAVAKAPRTAAAQSNLPTPIWNTWSEHIKFTFKDKRSVKIGKKQLTGSLNNRKFFALIYLAGLLVTVAGFALNVPVVIALGIILFWVAIIFAIKSPKQLLQERKKLYTRLFSIAKSNLGMPAEYEKQVQSYIKVLDWEDYVKPLKIEFYVPDNFSEAGGEGFLRQFNQIFGQETTWVPTDEIIKDEDGNTTDIKPGWNFAENKVTINAVPPLPTMAPWSEHYVLNDAIAWSFFPIALGVENGVELVNPKTGEVENVLGFDLSGLQVGVGKKAGVRVSSKITTSPMALVAGGTGSGKSLSLDTLVFVRKTRDSDVENSEN